MVEKESQREKGWRNVKVDPWVVDDVRAFFFVCGIELYTLLSMLFFALSIPS